MQRASRTLADKIERYFRELRFDKKHHLGFGDVRLTVAQQDEIVAMNGGEVSSDAANDLHKRLDIIAAELNHYAYGKGHNGYRYIGWEEIAVAAGALQRAIEIIESA